MEKIYLRDYVWMRPPDGGAPVKVSATVEGEIAQKMWRGFAQCDPPEGEEN
jgi:hypothetical protein